MLKILVIFFDLDFLLRNLYSGKSYHPSQYDRVSPPSSYKKIFNKRHSSLQSVVEKILVCGKENDEF